MNHAVFAYNFDEAQAHADESGLEHGQWIYADRRHKLEGIHPSDIITHQVEGWELNDRCRWAWEFYKLRCLQYGIGGNDE